MFGENLGRVECHLLGRGQSRETEPRRRGKFTEVTEAALDVHKSWNWES